MQQGRMIPYLLVTMLILVAGVVPLLSGNSAEAQVVSTLVGGGACDTCPATEAVLYNPSDVLLDGLGNIYIADFNNHRIRRVDAFGVITTIAGNGLRGFKGDGGPASAASLGGPFGIDFDPSGNLIFSESLNHRIRKINMSTGIISTIAGTGPAGFSGDGGPATAATLNIPRHVLVASSGEIYFSEVGNDRVRRIDVNGIITTVAGSGVEGFSGDGGPASSARLFNPFGLALDTQGNLFIADVDNHRVRRVSTSGIITTVAGTGSFTFSGDGGQATLAGIASPTRMEFDSAGNMYLPSSIPNHRVRRIVPGTDGLITGAADEIISTIAGNGTAGYSGDGGPATSAALNRPFAISRDSSGNLFIADFGNLRVRRIDASGTITTYAGNGLCCYSADQRPAIQATLNFPTGITRDASGNYFIADRDNHRIRVVNNQASPITVAGLTINPGNIRTIAGNGTPGYGGDNGPSTNAVLNMPYFIEVDGAGNIYFSDFANHRVRRINNSTGVITTVAGTGAAGYSGNGGAATSANFNGPLGLAFDSAGNLFIGDLNNHRVRRVSTGGIVTSVVGNGTTAFAGDGGPATSAAISNPTDISFDAAGALYIPLSAPQHRVRRVVPGSDGLITGVADEIITTLAGNGVAAGGGDGGSATAASLNRPFGTLVDTSGTLYIADASNFKVRNVTSGTITAFVGNGTRTHIVDFEGGNIAPADLTDELGDGLPGTSATTWFPTQLALHGPALLFADGGNHRIRALGAPAGDTTPPSVPTGVTTANVQCNSVTVNWTASTDNVGVTAYKVYRNSVLIATVAAPTTTYTDTTVAASTAYTYTVSAVDAAANESAQSTAATVTTPACPDTEPPSVPTGVATANVQCNSVTVNWTASTDNVGVTAYKVYRNSVLIATVAAPTTTYTDTTVAASTAYTYTVSAVDAAANESAQSTAATVTTPACPDTEPPSVPTGVATANVQCNSVTVNWTASTDNVGVTAYKVYRNSVLIATVAAPTTTYTDTTVAASTAYTYTVSAVDAAANESAQSTAATVTTPACPDTEPPSAPTAVATTSVQCNSVALTWSASTDNVGVTAYKVYRNSVLIATVTAPTTTYTDTTVAASTTYSYTITAVDAAANESAPSVALSVTTPACPDTEPPSVPTGLTATLVKCDKVSFTWSASTDNVAVTAYKVYRNNVLIATVSAPTTSYTDTTVAAQTTYTYTVTAVDAAGNESAQSSGLTVTTTACTPACDGSTDDDQEKIDDDPGKKHDDDRSDDDAVCHDSDDENST